MSKNGDAGKEFWQMQSKRDRAIRLWKKNNEPRIYGVKISYYNFR